MMENLEKVSFFKQSQTKTSKNEENCLFCTTSNIQRKILLQKVLLLFKSRMKSQINAKKNAQEFLTARQFDRLLTIIDPSLKSLIIPFCNHKIVIQPFISALKCTDYQFYSLCNTLAIELAKRNYQLDVLVDQIKSTGNTVLKVVKTKFKSDLSNEKAAKKQTLKQNPQQNSQIQRYSPAKQKSLKKEELYYVQSQKIITSNKTLESHLPNKTSHEMYLMEQNERYWVNFSLHMTTPYFYIPFPQNHLPNTFL